MQKMLFIQYPKCSTCRKAAKWLKDNNIEVATRNISEENPTPEELSVWITKSKLPVAKFFNTSGKLYRELNLKDKIKVSTEPELISIMASDGMLVKRPLLIGEDFILSGFNEEKWAEQLKG